MTDNKITATNDKYTGGAWILAPDGTWVSVTQSVFDALPTHRCVITGFTPGTHTATISESNDR